MMTDLSAVSSPAYPEHDGLPVRWEPWEESLPVTHIDPTCERCGYGGQSWICFGLLDGPPWPIRRLVAFRCPACADQRIYDMIAGPAGRDFTEVAASAGLQLDLFPNLPPSRPRRRAG